MFSLFNFSSIFPGGQLTEFAHICGRPCVGRCLSCVHLGGPSMLIDVDENDASRTSARERLFHILYPPPRLPRLRDDLYLALGVQRTIRIDRAK